MSAGCDCEFTEAPHPQRRHPKNRARNRMLVHCVALLLACAASADAAAALDLTHPAPPVRVATLRNVSVGPPSFAAAQSVSFDANKASLVVVDMQQYFLAAPDAPGRALVAPINAAAAAFRAANATVYWVNWGVRPDYRDWPGHSAASGQPWRPPASGSPGAALFAGLEYRPEAGDVLVEKYRETGFYRSQLDDVLRFAGVRTLFLAGVNTDQCVAGTLLDASRVGYDALLVTDLTATSSPRSVFDAAVFNSPYAVGSDSVVAALAAL